MAGKPSKNGGKTAGKGSGGRFVSGNRFGQGRPSGSRNRATLALEALIEGQGEAVVNAMITAAVAGDIAAGRALLDRLVPPRKDRPVRFTLPPLTSAADGPAALAAITAAAADGTLAPAEASDLAALVERFVRAVEVTELETRLRALEERTTR
jgi:hypothetical protein